MKYSTTITIDFTSDEQEFYDSLIENGYLPDEADREIRSRLGYIAERIETRADNEIFGGYAFDYEIERID